MTSTAYSPSRDAELEFLEELRSQYERQGYQFLIHPDPKDIPKFLGTYRPDALASKADRQIVVEVKTKSNSSTDRSLQQLQRMIEGQSNWELVVAYMGSGQQSSTVIPLYNAESIQKKLDEASSLADQGHFRPAFVLAWSLLEAAMHRLAANPHRRPTTPGTVVQYLAMQGLLEPDAERQIRSLISLRNRIVHGDLNAEPTEADVSLVLRTVAETLKSDPLRN